LVLPLAWVGCGKKPSTIYEQTQDSCYDDAQVLHSHALGVSFRIRMDRLGQFPASLTPFFGRKKELQSIASLLQDPACRLLALVGPGGIGKTRLAVEASQAAQELFRDGVVFIELQPLSSGDLLPITLLDALGLSHAQEDPLIQLAGFLADRQLLLVMDNFEHLLSWSDLLTRLLVSSPGLKLLVTTRTALNLQEEWQFPVSGIDMPPEEAGRAGEPVDPRSTSAVQMFAACARRVRPDFSLESELEPVIAICRSVEGMPLALELAASWTRILSCEIIAREIKENIRFLASSLRNIPERHRSVRAVFEQTWRMLSPDEQQVYKALSVFPGGFTQAAARQVAQASLPIMLALADKSLLRRMPAQEQGQTHERFQLHELLQQFAHELLAENETELRQAHDRHSDYYLAFLQERAASLLGGGQQAAVQEIHVELKNVRAAWNWAVQEHAVEKLQAAVPPLDLFFQYQSRFTEGKALFQQTIAALEEMPGSESRTYTQALLLNCLSWYYIRLGNFKQADEVLEPAIRIFESLQIPPPSGPGYDPQLALAILAVLRGAYSQAVALATELLQESEARQDIPGMTSGHYALASAWLAQGEYHTARQHARHACDLAREIHDEWMLAYCLKQLGDSFYGSGDPQQARQYYQQTYQLRQSFNDPEGMALALTHLGKVALLEQNYPEAQNFFQESCDIYTSIYDRGGLSTALSGLGETALRLGQFNQARQHLSRALQIAHEIRYVPLVLSIIVYAAGLLIQAGKYERSRILLHVARTSPTGDQETRRLAEAYLADCQPCQDEKPASGSVPDAEMDLDSLAQELLIELAALPELPQVASTPQSAAAAIYQKKDSTTRTAVQSESQLIDPLTEREIEILRCLSEGFSNQSIAEQLVLSLGTVKWYTSQIYGKLQVGSRTQAVARARQLGIL
jgi:predicted ATPase/DNA-binding CsgD family transcriptional regulator/Tfp pilus assembly protein PilF